MDGDGWLVLVTDEAATGKSSVVDAFRARPRILGPINDIAQACGGEPAAHGHRDTTDPFDFLIRVPVARPAAAHPVFAATITGDLRTAAE